MHILCMCLTLFFALCVPAENIRKFPKRRVNSEFTGLAHNLALLIILPGHDLSEPTEPFYFSPTQYLNDREQDRRNMDEYLEAVERRKQETQYFPVSPTEPFSLTATPTQYLKCLELANYL